ncbi:hypothetical protein BVC80_551g52 [Macleaya cordata]|uniref:HMA domain-containing protein n=1 Tax=Macleaya cordata TaxID=56857 RepID=A0A200QE44_MACCD|nr:hypothetical protein BVC80_551g52 [Macleaya cordata]
MPKMQEEAPQEPYIAVECCGYDGDGQYYCAPHPPGEIHPMISSHEYLGVDKVEVDAALSTFTVTGDADPYEVVIRARKSIKVVEVVSIGPPPPPPKPDGGGGGGDGQKKADDDGKKKQEQQQQKSSEMIFVNTYPQTQPCHMCVRVVRSDYDPTSSCSIL